MNSGVAHRSPAAFATMVVVHWPLPNRAKEYEDWLRGVRLACRDFGGHLGADVIRPAREEDGAYTVVVRFETRDQLDAWLHSSVRAEAARQLTPLLTSEEAVSVSVGDDIWFTVDRTASAVPRRHKQFLLTFASLFPMSLFVQPFMSLFGSYLSVAPESILLKAATTAVLVGLLLWVVFPVVTPRLRRWLTT